MADQQSELRIVTLGGFRVEGPHGPIGGEWLRQRPGQLLKYVVTERHRTAASDQIAEALWPEAGPSELRGRLRYYVHRLREKIEPDRARRSPARFVVAHEGGYSLDTTRVWIDADAFEREARAGLAAFAQGSVGPAATHLRDALRLYQGRFLADYWTGLLDASLADLGTDYVDAYYLMGVGEPEVVRCEQLHEAFLKAKQAGKVGHWGVSTHKRAQQVLEAMIGTGWYDLAMIAITPAGWYDWDSKSLLPGTPAMVELQPTLQRARDAGIGLVGMKAARYLSSRGGKELANAFDGHYSDKVMQSGLSSWQRSYAFVLAHGVDVVNSDMQNFAHFKENLAAVQSSAEIFVRA